MNIQPGAIPQARDDARQRQRFLRRLRAAGWRRIGGDAAVYEHPAGGKFDADGYDAGRGVAWRWYAERGELPGTGKAAER